MTSLRPGKSFRSLYDDLVDPLLRGRVFLCFKRRTLLTVCRYEYSKISQENNGLPQVKRRLCWGSTPCFQRIPMNLSLANIFTSVFGIKYEYVGYLSLPDFVHTFCFPQLSSGQNIGGPSSSVGIATGYGLDGPGSNPGGARFYCHPDWPWVPPRLQYNGNRVFPGGRKRPGHDADPSPTSSVEV